MFVRNISTTGHINTHCRARFPCAHCAVPRMRRINCTLQLDTTHLIQRPCYQRGNPCQDPAGNRTTRRPPDDRKETQTAVVCSCLPFTRSGQNHFARHSEMGKKTRQTEEEVGRQHQGMDKPGVRQVPGGSGEQKEKKWRKLVVRSSVVPYRPSRLKD